MTTDYLLTKLPMREHAKNIVKIVKYVREMDRHYFPGMAISLLLKTAVPYAELLLTAYILDGISAHTAIREMREGRDVLLRLGLCRAGILQLQERQRHPHVRGLRSDGALDDGGPAA